MEIPRHWRLRKQRYSLTGEICPEGHKLFPPRDICPQCKNEAKTPYQFSGKGEIYSHTTAYEGLPDGFQGLGPLTIALIKLEEGPIVTAQLTDLGDKKPEIGMPVEMVTRRLQDNSDEQGIIIYGYKFRPADDLK
jgi:hypothetical protein